MTDDRVFGVEKIVDNDDALIPTATRNFIEARLKKGCPSYCIHLLGWQALGWSVCVGDCKLKGSFRRHPHRTLTRFVANKLGALKFSIPIAARSIVDHLHCLLHAWVQAFRLRRALRDAR